MKKFISCFLSAIIVCSLSVSVFAAESPKEVTLEDAGSANQDVCVQVVDKDGNPITDIDAEPVYYVNITFDSLHFTFKTEQDVSTLTWDGEKYEGLTGTWSETQKVTVTNHSNRGVKCDAYFAANGLKSTVKKGVTATVTGSAATLAAASQDAGATSKGYSVATSGTPYIFGDFAVDTVTVSIAKLS